MNNRRALFLQAIRGPILLIMIGTLFVWQQAGIISFSRTWPLILIVLGVLRLLERVAAPAPYTTQQAPPPGTYPGNYPAGGPQR